VGSQCQSCVEYQSPARVVLSIRQDQVQGSVMTFLTDLCSITTKRQLLPLICCSRPVQHNHQTPIATSDMLFKPALTARVNGRAIGIPELHGAAISKTPWNATGKPYSFSKFCAAGCSICSELCHFSLYFRVLSITLNPLCKDKAICVFWSNRLGSFCLCSSTRVIENNSIHNVQ
jgi:hypothetical protein